MKDLALDLPNKAYMLPDPIPTWPPAWWFWLVLALIVMIMVSISIIGLLRYRRRAYRREAITLIRAASTQQQSDQMLIQLCIESIRRCLVTEGREILASTPTKALLPVLDQSIKRPKYYLQDLDQLYTQRLYQARVTLSPKEHDQLIHATCYWIRKHHA